MGITSVSEIAASPAPATPVSVVASTPTVAPVSNQPAKPATEPKPVAPPAPPPDKGFDVEVGEHEATGRKVYGFVDPDSGQTVVQIPAQAVLDLVGEIIRKLEAEGLR